MGRPFRHAMCNEAFQGRSFAAACAAIRLAGYAGVEVAPFTLGEAPAQIGAAQRREYRDAMASEGLAFAGLHWLMVAPKGLHLTAPDAALRAAGVAGAVSAGTTAAMVASAAVSSFLRA